MIRKPFFSKLPMRQLTIAKLTNAYVFFSKLPMRQLTCERIYRNSNIISKLPMRQLTKTNQSILQCRISKLPMRQLTMLEWKKKPTARALIHLFPTLTQIYSCLEIY